MRPMLWLGLLAAGVTALAVSWLPGEDAASVVGPAPAPQRPARVATANTGAPGRLSPTAPTAPTAPTVFATVRPAAAEAPSLARAPWPELDATASAAWMPPPPPAPAPPPTPPVPPFPYQWLGLLDDDGVVQIFLDSPQSTRVAGAGEVLDQRWRIDGVVQGRLQVTWLPTGATQHVGSR